MRSRTVTFTYYKMLVSDLTSVLFTFCFILVSDWSLSGHVLVVDEADKAPTNVTCILKTLVESGEMHLSDGRRIVSCEWRADVIAR